MSDLLAQKSKNVSSRIGELWEDTTTKTSRSDSEDPSHYLKLNYKFIYFKLWMCRFKFSLCFGKRREDNLKWSEDLISK